MANLLYLVHRLPYPPNKGDKVRSYHLLKHLAARHRVFLGTFIDDPDDEVHVDRLRAMCADVCVVRLNPRLARLRSLSGLLRCTPLSLDYYRDTALRAWVASIRSRHGIDASVMFSSVMAQYGPAPSAHGSEPMLVDFVDVDSAKWTQYAHDHRWPMSWVYAREGRVLLAFERQVASKARRSFFVTEQEAAMFRELAAESAGSVDAVGNGVDTIYFSPDPQRSSPYSHLPSGTLPIVFTGAMDYWPNIDAVKWFVNSMLPELRKRWPTLRFYIVGRSPSEAVRALASDVVTVTGTVPDVRPYLQHAAVVVAPMRVARGVQNKILEAMAMARPVVAASTCVSVIDAREKVELLSAEKESEYIEAIDAVLGSVALAAQIGDAGRRRVLASYSWEAQLAKLDAYLPSVGYGSADATTGVTR